MSEFRKIVIGDKSDCVVEKFNQGLEDVYHKHKAQLRGLNIKLENLVLITMSVKGVFYSPIENCPPDIAQEISVLFQSCLEACSAKA